MANRDVIVIGASAGGLPALLALLAPLPPDLPASFFVTVHTAPDGSSMLPEILERTAAFRAAYARDSETIARGCIYVAPPDHHLLVKRGRVSVTRGPRENLFRPAVDPLFRTAARAYGPRVIGIVLSGGLDDGTHGLEVIKRHGGLAIAQDPEDAIAPNMPLSAIQNVEVDYILSPSAIGEKLPMLVQQDVPDEATEVPEGVDVAEGRRDNLETGQMPGPPSPYTCPDCGGSLWELEDGTLLRFRCHVGHGFTAESLHMQQGEELEHTLWIAFRALEEQSALRRRMAQHAERVGRVVSARQLESQARVAEERAEWMRRLLMSESRESDRKVAATGVAAAGKRGRRPT
ncbi:MAG TPA: chemotaxis protein CheB [Vicinamibacterales bacterium]|nr:chemotaxis protein CheB [Vicinamibacterales bacterium]